MTNVTTQRGDASREAEGTVTYSFQTDFGQEGNLMLVGLLATRHDDDQLLGAQGCNIYRQR